MTCNPNVNQWRKKCPRKKVKGNEFARLYVRHPAHFHTSADVTRPRAGPAHFNTHLKTERRPTPMAIWIIRHAPLTNISPPNPSEEQTGCFLLHAKASGCLFKCSALQKGKEINWRTSQWHRHSFKLVNNTSAVVVRSRTVKTNKPTGDGLLI